MAGGEVLEHAEHGERKSSNEGSSHMRPSRLHATCNATSSSPAECTLAERAAQGKEAEKSEGEQKEKRSQGTR